MKTSAVLFASILIGLSSARAEDLTKKNSAQAPSNVYEMAMQGDLERLKKVASKVDLNAQDADGMTPLMMAALTGQIDVIRFLVEKKVNLESTNKVGDTALAVAVGNDQQTAALALLKAGAQTMITATEDKKPLIFAVVAANQTTLLDEMLKKNRLLVQTVDDKRENALFDAVRYGSADTLKILIQAGANRRQKNEKGLSALDLAKTSKNKVAAKLLSAK